MSDDDLSSDQRERLQAVIHRHLAQGQHKDELLLAMGKILDAVWTYLIQFLGQAGARAVMRRAIVVAARENPLVGEFQLAARDDRVDLNPFFTHLNS